MKLLFAFVAYFGGLALLFASVFFGFGLHVESWGWLLGGTLGGLSLLGLSALVADSI